MSSLLHDHGMVEEEDGSADDHSNVKDWGTEPTTADWDKK